MEGNDVARQARDTEIGAKEPKCIQNEPETGATGEKEGPEGPSLGVQSWPEAKPSHVGELEDGVVGGHLDDPDGLTARGPGGALLERDPDGK